MTYLAPSLPEELFGAIAALVAERLQARVELAVDSRRSGPPVEEPNPFETGRFDFGFMCAPSYSRLASSIRLVGACPVFDDPRLAGRPAYFSDVIARRAGALPDPAKARWAYNDQDSLSGYYNALEWLDAPARAHFHATARCSGSHLASIEAVVEGEVDQAAIDSNVLGRVLQARPELADRIRIVHSIGPCPVQPLVARATLPSGLVSRAREALLEARGLERFGVTCFAPVSEDDYAKTRVTSPARVAV